MTTCQDPDTREATSALREVVRGHNSRTGTELEQWVNRRYSSGERLRYCWPDPAAREELGWLEANVSSVQIPQPLINQHVATQCEEVREGEPEVAPEARAFGYVNNGVRTYACAGSTDPTTQELNS